MPEFYVGDTVRVEMPRGYNKRGVLGVSVLYTTSPEAKFEGATGRVTEASTDKIVPVLQDVAAQLSVALANQTPA